MLCHRGSGGSGTLVQSAPRPFSLALIDMNIAGTSGLHVAAALRQSRRARHAMLLLTSADQPPNSAHAAVVNGFLVKPIGQRRLLEAIRAAIGSRVSREQNRRRRRHPDARGTTPSRPRRGRQPGQSEARAAPARAARSHAILVPTVAKRATPCCAIHSTWC
jgi:DNA-binding NarL/FixJ family response regulator